MTRQDQELRPWQIVAAFLMACFVLVLRHPDSLLHPQFFAEDGAIWFAEAYNWGAWKAMLWTYNGYYQSLPRFAAAVAVLVPLRMAPLVCNVVAIAIQALPAGILLSKRSAPWGTLGFRISLALVYLLLPNTREILGTVTLSQGPLALCALLLLLATPPRSTGQKALDLCVYVVCGLTGPFCLFLLPVAWLHQKHKWRKTVVTVLLACSVLQTAAIVLHHADRTRPELGASVGLFLRLLAGQVYLATVLGLNGFALHMTSLAAAMVVVVGSIFLAVAGGLSSNMRHLLFLAGGLFLASLANPVMNRAYGLTAWQTMAFAAGAHYWFLPSLALAWSICWCFRSQRQTVKILAGCAALLMLVGVLRDFRYPAFPDEGFSEGAARLRAAPVNSVVAIPLYPEGWHMELIKR
jgi:hypothetical protein